MLNIYNFIESTKTLGPYSRFALWTQGCPFSCLGCMTPDSQSFDAGVKITVDDMAELILKTQNIEGITISGGEPFSQVQELYELICLINKSRDLGVVVYTGFSLEQLYEKNDTYTDLFLDSIDILIDGTYEENLNDGISLRGSSNQNTHQLTQRYLDIFDDYYNKNIREVEIHMQDKNMMLVGIPKTLNLKD